MAAIPKKTSATVSTDRRVAAKWSKVVAESGWTSFPNVIFERQQALQLTPLDINILLHLAGSWWNAGSNPYRSKKVTRSGDRCSPADDPKAHRGDGTLGVYPAYLSESWRRGQPGQRIRLFRPHREDHSVCPGKAREARCGAGRKHCRDHSQATLESDRRGQVKRAKPARWWNTKRASCATGPGRDEEERRLAMLWLRKHMTLA